MKGKTPRREEGSGPAGPQALDGAEAVAVDGAPDILVRRRGREFRLLGPAGPARELSFLPETPVFPGAEAGEGGMAGQTRLPVVIGAGTGTALEVLCARMESAYGADFILAVADKELDIQAVSGVRERFSRFRGLCWIDAADSGDALKALTAIQAKAGGIALLPLVNPAYLRLDREWCAAIRDAANASAKADFWTRARHAKFAGGKPRLLLLTSQYFLMGEIVAACERLGFPHSLLQVSVGAFGQSEFIERLLTAVVDFKPDFAFTINHLGVDREGVLTDLLEKLRLPLASWFVDNPHLVLYRYSGLQSPWLSIFTWDTDNILSLKDRGFAEVSYLPLGTDARRFTPYVTQSPPPLPGLPPDWDGRVAFVGNSMVHKVRRKRLRPLGDELLLGFERLAAEFGQSDERSVAAFLADRHPGLAASFEALPSIELQLEYETMITWEATRQYRLDCVRGILPFAPLVAGDDGWKTLLGRPGQPGGDGTPAWFYHSELAYYDELPRFYPHVALNFNCTSQQMKGAVNQRVFDVPAAGAFLLTDYREQVERLFEPGREIVCYRSPEEATALAGEYLEREDERRRVAEAARRRILAEHTYEHRLRALAERMRAIYA
ncbi:MAG: glycosyltransferase [Desulfovibrio sp.]|jgi:spore maturation protein CgeB|nr:glycosyltransferase [Desulfovibrio sp.]